MGPTTSQATPWGAIGSFASSLIGLGLNNTMQQQQYNQNVDLMNLQHQNQMALLVMLLVPFFVLFFKKRYYILDI